MMFNSVAILNNERFLEKCKQLCAGAAVGSAGTGVLALLWQHYCCSQACTGVLALLLVVLALLACTTLLALAAMLRRRVIALKCMICSFVERLQISCLNELLGAAEQGHGCQWGVAAAGNACYRSAQHDNSPALSRCALRVMLFLLLLPLCRCCRGCAAAIADAAIAVLLPLLLLQMAGASLRCRAATA
jgi:hypothetical protein